MLFYIKMIREHIKKCICTHRMLFILILNILAIFAIYEQYNNVQETTVYIYTYGNKDIESNGTSIRLTNINADGQNLKLKDFFSNNCAEYDDICDDIIIRPKENEETIFSLNLKPYEKIELTFLKSSDSGICGIKDGDAYIEVDLYSPEFAQYEYECISNKKTDAAKDILIKYFKSILPACIILLVVIVYFCHSALRQGDRMLRYNNIVIHVCIINLLLLLLSRIYVPLKFEYVLMISSLMLFCYLKRMTSRNDRDVFKSLFLRLLVYFYITFSLCGASIFLPLQKMVFGLRDIAVFGGMAYTIHYVIDLLLEYLQYKDIKKIWLKMADKYVSFLRKYKELLIFIWSVIIISVLFYLDKGEHTQIIKVIGVFVILLAVSLNLKVSEIKNDLFKFFCYSFLIFLPVILIFNSGNITSDTLDQYQQAHGMIQLSDHHPVVHTFFERFLYYIVDSTMFIAICQVIVYSLVMARAGIYLKKRGMTDKEIYLFLSLNVLWLPTIVNIVTLWKDIWFSVFLLWLVILLAELVDDSIGFFNRKMRVLELFISLCGVSTFRHNGIMILIGMILLFIIVALNKKLYKIFPVCLLLVVVVLGGKKIILKNCDVSPNGSIVSVVLFHGLAYKQYLNEPLLFETQQYMDSILPPDIAKKQYYSYSANSYMFDEIVTEYNTMNKFRNSDLKEVLQLYIKEFLKSPYLILKDRLYGTDLLWNVFRPKEAYNYMYEVNVEDNELGIERIHTPYEKTLQCILKTTETYEPLFWRGGLYIDILVILLLSEILKKRYRTLIIVSPIILNIGSLFLSMAWQEYRYVWFLTLVTPFVFGILYVLDGYTVKKTVEQQKYYYE